MFAFSVQMWQSTGTLISSNVYQYQINDPPLSLQPRFTEYSRRVTSAHGYNIALHYPQV